MSRIIKFRAWNNKECYMCDFSNSKNGIEFSCGEFFVSSGYDSYDNPTYDEETDYTIMQFVGLQDKNSKDIYESDIISDHVGVGVVKYSDKYAEFRVCYGDGQCKWFYDYILNGERESIEVIGNTYENPELLKDKP